ncbi:MAG: DNA-3-methyladenine glycosylase [Spirosomaceae bacterium]|nr:DNA-3-methyladenine glycosylase [Spirosomataceae bacterium]
MLPAEFYFTYDTLTLSQKLLGCELVHDSAEGITAGIIVETEGYLVGDPACHAYRNKTKRNAPMFGVPGNIYVYQIYGMYLCVNISSGGEGVGEAVLIRALQPTQGQELMQERRSRHKSASGKVLKEKDLCNGPAKLVQAMGITKLHNNFLVYNSEIYCNEPILADVEIVTTTRIGITQGADLPYRFYVKGNRFVSRK